MFGMNSSPTYRYAALDPQLRSLVDELESMGGGDATAKAFENHCVVNVNLQSSESQVLWLYEASIGMRDALMPSSQRAEVAMKYMKVTQAYNAASTANNLKVFTFLE